MMLNRALGARGRLQLEAVVAGYAVLCILVFLSGTLGRVLGIIGLLVAIGVYGRRWRIAGAVVRGLALFLWGAFFLLVVVTAALSWFLGQTVMWIDFLIGGWVIVSAVLLSGILEGKKKVTAGRIAWLLTVTATTYLAWQGSGQGRRLYARYKHRIRPVPGELRRYMVRPGSVVSLAEHGWRCELVFTNIGSRVVGLTRSNWADYVWRCWSNNAEAVQSGTGQVYEAYTLRKGRISTARHTSRKDWIEAGPFFCWWGYGGPDRTYLYVRREDRSTVLIRDPRPHE